MFLFLFYCCLFFFFFFFFNDTATTEIYTLSLHDALPIWRPPPKTCRPTSSSKRPGASDRKSTRLNSSHANISYAVFCLKKKKKKKHNYKKKKKKKKKNKTPTTNTEH